ESRVRSGRTRPPPRRGTRRTARTGTRPPKKRGPVAPGDGSRLCRRIPFLYVTAVSANDKTNVGSSARRGFLSWRASGRKPDGEPLNHLRASTSGSRLDARQELHVGLTPRLSPTREPGRFGAGGVRCTTRRRSGL